MYWFSRQAQSRKVTSLRKNIHGISRDDFWDPNSTFRNRMPTFMHLHNETNRVYWWESKERAQLHASLRSPSSLGMERVPAWKQNILKCEISKEEDIFNTDLVHSIGSVVQQLQTCAALCQIIFKLCPPKLYPPNSSFLEPQPLFIEIRLTKNIVVTLTDVSADLWNHWLWVRKAPNKSIPTIPLPPRAHVSSHVRPGVHPRVPPRTLLHVRK